jgi:uncharacterized protein involved in response to NO
MPSIKKPGHVAGFFVLASGFALCNRFIRWRECM